MLAPGCFIFLPNWASSLFGRCRECAGFLVLMIAFDFEHTTELAAWQSNQSSTSSSSGAFSWRGSVSSNGDSPPHGPTPAGTAGTGVPGQRVPVSGRKLKFRSATPSPPLMSGSAPANYSGSVLKFHSQQPSGRDDGIASDESISECDEESPVSKETGDT